MHRKSSDERDGLRKESPHRGSGQAASDAAAEQNTDPESLFVRELGKLLGRHLAEQSRDRVPVNMRIFCRDQNGQGKTR